MRLSGDGERRGLYDLLEKIYIFTISNILKSMNSTGLGEVVR